MNEQQSQQDYHTKEDRVMPVMQTMPIPDHNTENNENKKKKNKKEKRKMSSSESNSSESDDGKKKKNKKSKQKKKEHLNYVENNDLKVMLIEQKLGEMEKKDTENKLRQMEKESDYKQRQLERQIDELKAKTVNIPAAPIIINNNNNNNNDKPYYAPVVRPIYIPVVTPVYVRPNNDCKFITISIILGLFVNFFSNIYLLCIMHQITNKKKVFLFGNILNMIILIIALSVKK